MTHYYSGRSGDSFTDATIHATDDCPALSDPVRPLADSSVPDDADWCDDCGRKGGDPPQPACSKCGQSHDDGACWDLIEDGICPWCDDYEGEHVGQHASSAHPEAWTEYRD